MSPFGRSFPNSCLEGQDIIRRTECAASSLVVTCYFCGVPSETSDFTQPKISYTLLSRKTSHGNLFYSFPCCKLNRGLLQFAPSMTILDSVKESKVKKVNNKFRIVGIQRMALNIDNRNQGAKQKQLNVTHKRTALCFTGGGVVSVAKLAYTTVCR